jgi:hypothetical protein
MQYNYSAWPLEGEQSSGYELKQMIALSLGNSECIDTLMVPERSTVLALCWRAVENDQKEYFLSLVSTVSAKTFIVCSTVLSFQGDVTPKLQFVNNVVVVYSANIAVLLTIWEIQETLQFVELDQIDRQDIAGTICALELISNSTSPQA